jgi:hypothetical protein
VLADNPLLGLLGRRGAGAVVATLCSQAGPWTLRGLARAAKVPAMAAWRTVQALEALAAVEVLRPGRDAIIRRRDGPAAEFLLGLAVPDLRSMAWAAFAAAYGGPGRVVRWTPPGARDDDPTQPTRLAILSSDDAAWDHVDGALDAVRAARLAPPEVTVHDPAALDAGDPVAAALLQASGTG